MRTAAQSLRLAQETSTVAEGEALVRLAYFARDSGGLAELFAQLAATRIGSTNQRNAGFVKELELDYSATRALGSTTQSSLKPRAATHQADRGASLLREAFGIDVAEIDALNERLGATRPRTTMRDFLRQVQQYCARDEPTAIA